MNLRRGGSTWLPNFEYNPDMIIRAKNMLALLDEAEYKFVLDLGCGVQYLRDLIPSCVEYLGVDLYKHKDDTIICDFNKKQFPNLNSEMCVGEGGGGVDLVFIAGLLEYVKYKKWFLAKACQTSNRYILLSYNFKEFVTKPADIWLSLSRQREIFDIMFKNDFKLSKLEKDPIAGSENTTLYMFFERSNLK